MDRRDAVADRVNDFGDHLPGFEVLPRQRTEHQQPADRRRHRFHAGQGSGRVGQVGQWRRFTGNRAELDQVIDQRLAVEARQRVADVALAAQFDGDRKTAQGNVEVLAEPLFQLPPEQGEALVERLAAGIGSQQTGLGADVAGQRLDL
ncbi:hypothetical protein D3C76_1050690 [compost metagenome]